MIPILKNIIAVVAGLLFGSAANMLTLQIGMALIPPPEGFDMNTPEGLNAAFAVMETKHFISPFLSHALGTFVGAFIVARFAARHHKTFAYVIAGLFFLGGLYMVLILNAPMWFNLTDLILAYFPMAWLALRLNKVK
jgi:hypothetical protein